MDYRFAIRCWQDQAGDENAKANVFVDGVQVLTEVEITATSEDSPQIVAWESTGLEEPAADATADIKVVLVNEYYVDSVTDRNISINGIGIVEKSSTDSKYKVPVYEVWETDSIETVKTYTEITDFTNFNNYRKNGIIPTAVTGDQIADDWWASRGDTDSFYTIAVFGSADIETGVTMTVPLHPNTNPTDWDGNPY